jgi:hypothetical protein
MFPFNFGKKRMNFGEKNQAGKIETFLAKDIKSAF